MKFSFNWLKQWVDLDIGVRELAERLTASGLEVGGISPVAGAFEGVIVGRITDCRPHPDADKLVVCTVDAGDGRPRQVVCGAPNARAGLLAPLAKVGARLGADFEVENRELRGVESEGMLCSARELGLGDDHSGLLELPPDAAPGDALGSVLDLDDFSIELDLTPNRGDCLSIRGIARDVSASCNARFHEHERKAVQALIEDRLPIRLEDPEGCPRYAGRIVRGIDPRASTPLWMREALRRCGLRPISPVVDVTNFVMLELGQPMHAFDLGRIDSEIVVRRGRAGESLVLLDGQEVPVDESVLAICDAAGPLALGGVMGGLDSAVGEDTTDVLFEAAWFKPATIMGKARDLGLHTDASHRFERGVDTGLQLRAMERATQLLLEIAGGSAGPVVVAESTQHIPVNPTVILRPARLNRVLGLDVAADEAAAILARLGMQCSRSREAWEVVAPSARFDIAIEEDLIEEIARIHGYDAIPEAMPSGALAVGTAAGHEVPLSHIRSTLCAAGYQEVINYSFVDPALLATFHMSDGALPLANPLSSDMSVMRTGLVPGLVASLARNTRRQHTRVRLFETGVTFFQAESLRETDRIAAAACGTAWPEQWGNPDRAMDFFDVKGDVERLLALRGATESLQFEAESMPWMHPGASATVYESGERGRQRIGYCGALHPAVVKSLDISTPVYVFELELKLLQSREVPIAKPYSRFPSVRRDLALEVPDHVLYAEVRSCVVQTAGEILQNLVIFDVYEGQYLTKGYKSLAIGLILQHVSSTLTDEAVDELVREVVSELEQRLGARLRG